MKADKQRWRSYEPNPEFVPEFSRTPDSIEHELDLETLRYDWTAHFINSDPWAESSRSQAVRSYELQRDADGWRMRLIGRNYSTFDTPHDWEPAPEAFRAPWDAALAAWKRR